MAGVAQPDFRRSTREYTQVFTDSKHLIGKYGLHRQAIRDFLEQFQDKALSDDIWGTKKYMTQLQKVVDGLSDRVDISLDDLQHSTMEEGLVEAIMRNTQRYHLFFVEECHAIMPQPSVHFQPNPNRDVRAQNEWREAVDDHINSQRALAGTADPQNKMPERMKWDFVVYIHLPKDVASTPLREVKSGSVGRFIKMDGVVTKAAGVKAKVEVATYLCETCGETIWQVVDSDAFMPIGQCPTPRCKTNKTLGTVNLLWKSSKFVKYQEVRVQEPSHAVPVGSVPRTMLLALTHHLTRSVLPGDAVTVSGIYLPIQRHAASRMRQRGRAKNEMCARYIHVFDIEKHKKGYAEQTEEAEMSQKIDEAREDPDIVDKLARSIAPEIYGLSDVKKALLCLLVGGCTRQMGDGMRIRGDMHVLLMGDPGVAKSQLLKHLSLIAPRAVYTTGKGSSGVGLTASVQRDPQTNEMTLDGGALVMADNGICCIDEFDKMEESDRTAIHEVMEQQTVSIAKAGITTTLNARTSVVAAANPAYGRYNPKKSVLENLNLPAALLSRFDIQFLLLDTVNEDKDIALARHVGNVHRLGEVPQDLDFEPFGAEFMRAYVRRAREYTPTLDASLEAEIVNHYTNIRAQERSGTHDKLKTYTTPRTLLAILRLAQALARLRFSEVVQRSDFDEALRIIQASKASVSDSAHKGGHHRTLDPESRCWEDMSEFLRRVPPGEWASMNDLESYVQKRGTATRDVIQKTIAAYERINILGVSEDRTKICMLG
ncbi:protein PROLIFERA, putative [Perkinsus marinus ATCC 50983]|uniref:DNA helicase n=1 Tax=Perkinsus marinus (strain ATCC 50983 / TXsc) TaxID=423536 RepID=C5KTR7_PERM5|nr:protein PROLIFERA, putative [Perkinsus marinus ATCC 50983]EER11959.1 protein PROLIFERA, putative [Perkinsus marinus ATCC 50983]|eukprot:XP_002780164.1 protein PROLIFERA, putative [Perkinsus marinus ATCC 50983]